MSFVIIKSSNWKPPKILTSRTQGFPVHMEKPIHSRIQSTNAQMVIFVFYIILLWKIVWIEKKLCNLGSILAHQTSKFKFNGSWRIFWHSWDPWGRINSGDNRVLRFFLIFLHVSAIWRIFSFFSNWSQMSLLLIWHE